MFIQQLTPMLLFTKHKANTQTKTQSNRKWGPCEHAHDEYPSRFGL